MPKNSYPSKILLFGEYAVVCGGQGLAIPYPQFSAAWIRQQQESQFKIHLKKFCLYLKEHGFEKQLDLHRFESDLAQGLDLASDIPIGYGLGSSGVVVAAVYDTYAIEKIPQPDPEGLKFFLGTMENYFHHKSSGLDPLVCYLSKCVHLKPDHTLEIMERIAMSPDLRFTLIDTGISRSTNTFVTMFRERMLEPDYKNAIEHTYIPLVSQCIEYYIAADAENFYPALKLLSAFQLSWFDFAIPEIFRDTWETAIEDGTAIYKLCGAGGGGFMIRFENSWAPFK